MTTQDMKPKNRKDWWKKPSKFNILSLFFSRKKSKETRQAKKKQRRKRKENKEGRKKKRRRDRESEKGESKKLWGKQSETFKNKQKMPFGGEQKLFLVF